MATLAWIALRLSEDAFHWVVLLLRSNESVQAENLFLRRQLALYLERGARPRRIDAATRVSPALLAKLFDWRSALVAVQPATVIRCGEIRMPNLNSSSLTIRSSPHRRSHWPSGELACAVPQESMVGRAGLHTPQQSPSGSVPSLG